MSKSLSRNLLVLTFSGLLFAPAAAFADQESYYGNWSGPYIGAHVGGISSDFSNTAPTAGPSGSDFDAIGGGQIGANWQYQRLVLGVEGDISAMNLEAKQPGTSFREDWMSTVRGRAGFAVDRFLPYFTTGVGLTNTTSKLTGVGRNENVEAGLAIGAGVDTLLTDNGKWTGRIEYLNVDVPQDDAHVGGTTIRGGSSNNIIRFGANYKL